MMMGLLEALARRYILWLVILCIPVYTTAQLIFEDDFENLSVPPLNQPPIAHAGNDHPALTCK